MMKTGLFNCHNLFTKLLKWYEKVFLDIKLVGKQQKLQARYQTVEKNGPVRCYWLGNLSACANKSDVFLYPSPNTVTVVGNSLWPSSWTTFDCSAFLCLLERMESVD